MLWSVAGLHALGSVVQVSAARQCRHQQDWPLAIATAAGTCRHHSTEGAAAFRIDVHLCNDCVLVMFALRAALCGQLSAPEEEPASWNIALFWRHMG